MFYWEFMAHNSYLFSVFNNSACRCHTLSNFRFLLFMFHVIAGMIMALLRFCGLLERDKQLCLISYFQGEPG